MVAILTEIHLTEAKAQQVGFRSGDSTQLYYKYLEKQLFKKFKTDSTHYHDSYRFYSQHVKLMNEIYSAVVDTLDARRLANQKLGESKQTASVKKDSTLTKDSVVNKKMIFLKKPKNVNQKQ